MESCELREKKREEIVLVITDSVESSWRCVEEVDEIGNDGVGYFFLRHGFVDYSSIGAVLF
jgi:hypothetical protein